MGNICDRRFRDTEEEEGVKMRDTIQIEDLKKLSLEHGDGVDNDSTSKIPSAPVLIKNSSK